VAADGGVRVITPEIREQLAALLVVELGPGTPVLPYGVFGPFDPPAVVIGEPDWLAGVDGWRSLGGTSVSMVLPKGEATMESKAA
jgi:hypothetical protein